MLALAQNCNVIHMEDQVLIKLKQIINLFFILFAPKRVLINGNSCQVVGVRQTVRQTV